MFGYVKPNKNELKMKTVKLYSDIYCSLCQSLKQNFGFLARFTVNYDITFLYFVLFVDKTEKIPVNFRCPFNPLKKIKTSLSKEILDYCANINYLLTVEKLYDDCTDKKGIKKLFAQFLYHIFSKNKKYKTFIKENFAFYNDCKNQLQNYYAMEKNPDCDFDEILNTFGNFFKILIKYFSDEHFEPLRDMITEFAFQLGKWICLIDALDDFKDDMKKDSNNILTLIDENKTESQLVQSALMILQMINSKMRMCLHKSDILQSNELVSNFIQYGCQMVEHQILQKNYKEIIEKQKLKKWNI